MFRLSPKDIKKCPTCGRYFLKVNKGCRHCQKPKNMPKRLTWEAVSKEGAIYIQVPEIPPSLNVWKNWSPYKQNHYKKYLTKTFQGLVLENKLPCFETAIIQFTYFFSTNQRHDPDNYTPKFYLDALRYANIIVEDNSSVLSLPEPIMKVDKENPRVEIVIRPKILNS